MIRKEIKVVPRVDTEGCVDTSPSKVVGGVTLNGPESPGSFLSLIAFVGQRP